MFLVGPQGQVVRRNLRTAAEVDLQLEKLVQMDQAGVALDRHD
jgi:hypothetical protein